MDYRRVMRSALMFRAMQEIANEEIEFLQGTKINKFQVKKKFIEVRKLLEKEIAIDEKLYSVIDTAEIRSLREAEKELIKLDLNSEVEVEVELKTVDAVKTKVLMKVKDRLKQIRGRRAELLLADKTAAQAYFCIFYLIEKIVRKIPTLELDNVIELDSVIDSYFNGDFKFVNNTEFK